MFEQIKERFGIEKGLFYLLMLIILVAFAVAFYWFFCYVSKGVTLVAPKQGTDL